MEKLTYRLPFLIFYYPSDKQEALCSSAPSSIPVTPIFTSSLQYCNSPPRSQSQQPEDITDSDRECKILIKTLMEFQTHKSSQTTWNLAASASALSFSYSPLDCWCGKAWKKKAVASQKIFWRPWQNGWVSITVMRLQEWPPRFPHLCHLSPRFLQGIHSLLYNSLLSLLLLPPFLVLCSYSFFTIREIYKRCVHLCTCTTARDLYHMRSLRLQRNPGMCPPIRQHENSVSIKTS